MYRYFKRVAGVGTGNYIYFWKPKGLRDENIVAPATSDYSLNPQLSYLGTRTRAEFIGKCLKQDKITYTHKKIVNTYIFYELDKIHVKTDPTLVNCLFGAFSLTKNANIDKCKYFGYGTGFDRRGAYLLHSGNFGRNVIVFEVDMSSSIHFYNKKKDILILGKGSTQGLGEHPLTAKKNVFG